jgi:hypothetical protein
MAVNKMSSMATAIASVLVIVGSAVPARAQAQPAAAPKAPAAQVAPAVEVPLGALAPANLKKPRPKAPFDLTGTWFIDLSKGFDTWRSGPPYPKFKGDTAKAFEESEKAKKEGKSYFDWIGQCYPAGMPVIMTRVWPIAMIQLPTSIYMVSGFENELRIIYLDGRKHTPSDEVVRTFDGESIGRWEGDTLVVDTRSMTSDKHIIDDGLPVSDDFRIVERIRLINNGQTLEDKWTLIDPKNWEGEWTSTHFWKRQDDTDITEVECLPNLNEKLPATSSKGNILK